MHLSRSARASLAFALFSLWLAVLFAGFSGQGACHLLLLGGLSAFPWKRGISPVGKGFANPRRNCGSG